MSDLVNPLQAIIDQAASQKSGKELQKYAQRIDPKAKKVSQHRVLLLDYSFSMAELVSGTRKIDMLRQALNRPLDADEVAIAFSDSCIRLDNLQVIPDPDAGTALHLAILEASELKPRHTLVVSDGKPNNESAALAAARKLTGVINTLYIGPDNDRNAIAFMRRLARLGCGRTATCDLRKNGVPQLQQALLLLEGGK